MLSQLLALFGFFSLVLVAVYWVNRAVALFDQLISDGQSAWVFLEFSALSLPYVIWLVLPLSAFVAVVYVTNRMMNESEIVVMQATGFSPFRLARPVLIFGLIVMLMMSVLGHVLVPASRARLAQRSDQIAENLTSRFMVEGTFLHPAEGITFYIRDISQQGELRSIFLSDSRAEDRSVIYSAERALLVKGDSGPKLVMFDGMAQMLQMPDGRLSVTRFTDFAYDIGALIQKGGTRPPRLSELFTHSILGLDDATLAALGTTRLNAQNEIHDRFVQPLLAPVVALLGFAALLIGGFSRFGIWRQIALAVALLLVVKILANATVSAAKDNLSAIPLLYLPIVAGLVLAWLLLALSARTRRVRGGRAPGGVAA